MTNRKNAGAPFVDFGDTPELFVDDLTIIEEFGT